MTVRYRVQYEYSAEYDNRSVVCLTRVPQVVLQTCALDLLYGSPYNYWKDSTYSYLHAATIPPSIIRIMQVFSSVERKM